MVVLKLCSYFSAEAELNLIINLKPAMSTARLERLIEEAPVKTIAVASGLLGFVTYIQKFQGFSFVNLL